jgi:DNA-binding protein
MSLLKDQEFFEKSLKKSKKSPKVVKATEATSTSVEKVEAEASEVNKSLEKKPMTTEVQTIETEVEVVAKDKFVELQKALDQQKEQLEKALAQVAKFEAERKEALLKARKEEVLKAVKIAEHAEVIFKAVAEASDDDFKAVVKSLEALTVVVEKSDLFVEKGADKQEAPAVNGLEQILKAKYSKK